MNRFNRRVAQPGETDGGERYLACYGAATRPDIESRNHGRTVVRPDFYLHADDAGRRNREDHRARSSRPLAEHGGKVEKVEKWGTRKMAYRVAKQREGLYVYMALRSTQGELIKELERRLKVSDAVIKYMTVRLDEEIKRQQKLVSARREHRARRRPRKPMAAAPAAPPASATGCAARGSSRGCAARTAAGQLGQEFNSRESRDRTK